VVRRQASLESSPIPKVFRTAEGQDARLGGGPTMEGLEGLEKDYEFEATSSPSGVTHLTFTRAGA